ncbi:toprim domain-containing protein [Nocardia sp. NPDC051832]|uniref:toprim domain-containing protein n=1 Tax=Nocardia sp. NPDC051832 TaxID=3155673 RepID=UPI00342FCC19
MSTKRSWDTITRALDQVSGPGKASGHWVRYLCPVHEGDGRPHKPSLGVIYNEAKHKTLIRCFANRGCTDEAVLERLGLHVADLFDQPRENRSAPAPAPPYPPTPDPSLIDRALLAAGIPLTTRKSDLGRVIGHPWIAAHYIYEWPDGSPEGKVTRVHTPRRYGLDKDFWQERMTETGWEHGGFAPIPFCLPALTTAVVTGADIYICEGEKDVHTARHAGLTATCNAGGALAWRPAHATWLRGAHRIWIIADRDAPGYRFAAKVAATLHNSVDEIRTVQARDGKDLTDHLNAGHDITDLDPVPLLDETRSRIARQRRSPARAATRPTRIPKP